MSAEVLAFMAITFTVAYGVFGMTGFGAAMIAVPLLVQNLPLSFVVPMVVLLDLVCTSFVGARNWRSVATDELRRLLPALFLGVAIGATSLAGLGPKWPLVFLGVFVIAVAVYNALPKAGQVKPISAWWSAPLGVAGGIFSALFGTGGPIYTIYLARRVFDPNRFRATISVIILASGITRALSFGAAGLYGQPDLFLSAAGALPFCLLGLFAGSKLRHRVAPDRMRQALLLLLVCGGAGAIYRGWSL
ncbi:sulfite exporter TauE/SafE family protein [Paucibacter sp. PLA-PC-4]|uniref:sulfite exporter TauE/SafE family protein n=1 Tax=Paucibacter sp. PLA-PC-4 TaxID=2993655 RepID=UPI00224AD869|nr:sulfite exporter TauE/SafE family protein [Paucibacter sp. PLA-PC-4]MCX2863715.1 sulfite exporter TauE/SafE family protein [Paucibacter sp. PLA-PC-4]